MISNWIWILLVLYLVVSLCAILFDLWVMMSDKHQKKVGEQREKLLRALLELQIARIREGRPLNPSTQHQIYCQLRKVDTVLRFINLGEEYAGQEDFAAYLSQSGDLFKRLCRHYKRSQPMHRASFAWALASCRQQIPQTQSFLLSCVSEKRSIYCRENALTALYRSGNCDAVISALKRMSASEVQHSQKLFTDGFLSFEGDKTQLCAAMWKEFPRFSINIRLAIVDYMRLLNADYREELLPLLDSPDTDDEICFAILRYYGRCTFEPACHRMIEFMTAPRNGLWEYAAVSATNLRNYPGDEVVETLLHALSNHGWYVRYNAAESLVYMALPEEVYSQILSGKDRYAREITQYMMERKQLGQAARTSAVPAAKGGEALGVS